MLVLLIQYTACSCCRRFVLTFERQVGSLAMSSHLMSNVPAALDYERQRPRVSLNSFLILYGFAALGSTVCQAHLDARSQHVFRPAIPWYREDAALVVSSSYTASPTGVIQELLSAGPPLYPWRFTCAAASCVRQHPSRKSAKHDIQASTAIQQYIRTTSALLFYINTTTSFFLTCILSISLRLQPIFCFIAYFRLHFPNTNHSSNLTT